MLWSGSVMEEGAVAAVEGSLKLCSAVGRTSIPGFAIVALFW